MASIIDATTIRRVQWEDWAALYVDGYLYYEGHHIPEYIYLELLDADKYSVNADDYPELNRKISQEWAARAPIYYEEIESCMI